MRFKVISSKTSLTEEKLLEDKTVKFGGQTYPKFGWCVILCGGPGSGKSSTAIPIDAKTYNVDDIKTLMTGKHMEKVKVNKSDLDGDTMTLANGQTISLDEIPEPYNYSNDKFVGRLHKELRPLAKKVKQSIFDTAGSSSPDRLPNIIFDITGKSYEDFEMVVDVLKPLGYKIAVVWIMTTPTLALKLNAKRGRDVGKMRLLSIHRDVFKTLGDMYLDSKLLDSIDDIWVVQNYEYDPKDPKAKYNFITDANTFHIKDGKKLMSMREFPDRLYDALMKQMQDIDSYTDELASADID